MMAILIVINIIFFPVYNTPKGWRRQYSGNKRGGGTVLLAVKTELLAYRRPDLEPQN